MNREKATKLEELELKDQVIVVMIELLCQIAEGARRREDVAYVLADLNDMLPYSELSTSSVVRYATKVAEYGVNELPGNPKGVPNESVEPKRS